MRLFGQPNTFLLLEAADARLQARLGDALAALHASGELVGAQVCVWQHGVQLASVCCGTLGKVDPRPVRPDTLFNCFSVTKGVLATAVRLGATRARVAASHHRSAKLHRTRHRVRCRRL